MTSLQTLPPCAVCRCPTTAAQPRSAPTVQQSSVTWRRGLTRVLAIQCRWDLPVFGEGSRAVWAESWGPPLAAACLDRGSRSQSPFWAVNMPRWPVPSFHNSGDDPGRPDGPVGKAQPCDIPQGKGWVGRMVSKKTSAEQGRCCGVSGLGDEPSANPPSQEAQLVSWPSSTIYPQPHALSSAYSRPLTPIMTAGSFTPPP